MTTHTRLTTPLRNRLVVDLSASGEAVWAVIGDLTKFPEYSSGLETVTVTNDRGTPSEYVCHFLPVDQGAEGTVHRELIEWYKGPTGFASRADEPNDFGLHDAMTVVELKPVDGSTRLTWSQYYEAEDVDSMRGAFDLALEDIGANLIRRFGGRVVERYVDRDLAA